MKLAVAMTFFILAATPALAQVPAPRTADPIRDEISRLTTSCYATSDPRPGTLDQTEAAAKTCEEALIGIETAFAGYPEPTPRQRAQQAWQKFSLQRLIAGKYYIADLQAGQDPQKPSTRACGGWEKELVLHGAIDREALGRRASDDPDFEVRQLVRDLKRCRDLYGPPDGAKPLPVVASPPPPPPGMLSSDLQVFVSACSTAFFDRNLPLTQRLAVCQRASEWLPAVLAQHPDANEGQRLVYDYDFANVHIYLGLLQAQTDGGPTQRACQTLNKAQAARVRLSANTPFPSIAFDLLDDFLANPRSAACNRL